MNSVNQKQIYSTSKQENTGVFLINTYRLSYKSIYVMALILIKLHNIQILNALLLGITLCQQRECILGQLSC